MKYSEQVQRNLIELDAKFPDLVSQTSPDEDRRKLCKIVVEQCVFDEPNAGYGWKSRDSSAPGSKDNLACMSSEGFIGWDLWDGATRTPNIFPDSFPLDGQHFIQVTGVNHLNHGVVTKPPEIPNEDRPPTDNQATLNDIEELLLTIIHNQQIANENFALVATNLAQASSNLTAEISKLVKDGIPVRFGR